VPGAAEELKTPKHQKDCTNDSGRRQKSFCKPILSAISRSWNRCCHRFVSYLRMEIMRNLLVGPLVRDEDGQAVVEYLLVVSITITVTGMLAMGLRKTLFALWSTFAKDIVAACPGCPSDIKTLK
jgi:Flp pilus assembly pilin Flp